MKYYIYLHERLDKNVIFYVGKGTKTDKYRPYRRAYMKSGRNFLWNNIVNKYTYKVIIHKEFEDEEDCLIEEKRLIDFYGQILERTGTLTNIENEKGKKSPKHKESAMNSRKYICQYDLEGNFIMDYNSISEASEITGIAKTDISSASFGKRKKHTAGGFQWIGEKKEKIDSFSIQENGRYKNIIEQYSKEGDKLKEWRNVTLASKSLNISRSAIANSLLGKSKSSGGYIWKYKSKEKREKQMKTFSIPVTWEMYGIVEIEAESLEKAVEIFDRQIDDFPLPDDKNYVDASFRREDAETIVAHNQINDEKLK